MKHISREDLYTIICKEHILTDADTRILVLDKNLCVIFVNGELVDSLDHPCPGDLLQCTNAISSAEGCGSSAHCKMCKLRNTAALSLKAQKKTEADASLLLKGNIEYDVHLSCSPFTHDGENYTIVVVNNTTAKHREMMMERVFFHDMLNLSGALQGFLDCAESDNMEEILGLVKGLARQIIDEVNSQRDLIYAQKGMLQTSSSLFPASKVLEYTFETLLPMVQEHNKTMVLDNRLSSQELNSDYNLIHRILLNMIKNASEADGEGEKITLRAAQKDGEIIFSVHNHAAIPAEIRSEIFKYGKSFKGTGHGIGTYSIKLLGENYLGGKVWFTSSEENGTEFFFSLPQAK